MRRELGRIKRTTKNGSGFIVHALDSEGIFFHAGEVIPPRPFRDLRPGDWVTFEARQDGRRASWRAYRVAYDVQANEQEADEITREMEERAGSVDERTARHAKRRVRWG